MSLTAEQNDALSNGEYAVPIIIGSGVSIAASAAVLLLYQRYEELRRHPAGLVLVRVFCDIALAALLICEQATRLSLARVAAVAGYDSAASCVTYAFFFQCVGARARLASASASACARAHARACGGRGEGRDGGEGRRRPRRRDLSHPRPPTLARPPACLQAAAGGLGGLVPRHVARLVHGPARPLCRLQEEPHTIRGRHCSRLGGDGRSPRRPQACVAGGVRVWTPPAPPPPPIRPACAPLCRAQCKA